MPSMALKDRLDARRRPEPGEAPNTEFGLSVIDGSRPEPKVLEPQSPAEDEVQRKNRMPATVATAKAAIHALLVERHADDIDITDRESVRARITAIADEHVKNAGLAINRLDYGHLVDALLDEVLGLGPLQALL